MNKEYISTQQLVQVQFSINIREGFNEEIGRDDSKVKIKDKCSCKN